MLLLILVLHCGSAYQKIIQVSTHDPCLPSSLPLQVFFSAFSTLTQHSMATALQLECQKNLTVTFSRRSQKAGNREIPDVLVQFFLVFLHHYRNISNAGSISLGTKHSACSLR
jgi:hypothetical protein